MASAGTVPAGCVCVNYVAGCEHEIRCPRYEPPLTQDEIRRLRALLAADVRGV